MATTTAEPYHLRALILKIQDYLTDQDRQRLHFFLGPDVPRRIRDDISLTGTLNLIESLIEQDKINEQDFTFLINAFEVIQCHDAVKILKDCMKQMQTKGQSETLHKVSSILLDEHQEDKYARENLYVVVDIHSSHDTDNKATSDPIDTPTVHPLTIAVAESSSHMKPNQLLKIMKIVLITFVLLIFIGLIISTSIIATQNMKLKKELQTKEANLVDEQLMIKNYSNVNTKLMQQIVSLKQTILLSNMSQIPIGTKVMRNGVTIAGGDGKGDRLDQLLNPLFMTIADDRTIYISDQYNHRIVAWKKNATNGEIVAGGNGDGIQEDQLRYPRGVIIDRKTNTLIIADNGNKRVIRWPRQNGVKGETIISGIDCWGLAWDSSGDLYVSNREKNEVRRWKIGEDEGVLVAGGNGQGFDLNQLNGPRHLHIDQNDALYISDNGNSRVMKWTKGAKQGSIAGGGYGMGDSLRQFHFPNGIVVDQSGTLYVADYDNDRVMRWLNNATQGEVFVGGNGRGRRVGQLDQPIDVVFDEQMNFYVLEYGSNRIQMFSSDQFFIE